MSTSTKTDHHQPSLLSSSHMNRLKEELVNQILTGGGNIFSSAKRFPSRFVYPAGMGLIYVSGLVQARLMAKGSGMLLQSPVF